VEANPAKSSHAEQGKSVEQQWAMINWQLSVNNEQ
jgi:hypothetical protein